MVSIGDGTDTVDKKRVRTSVTYGATCLDKCSADSSHGSDDVCIDNVDTTITNANEATDQTKSVRKDDTYSWTLTVADADDEDTVVLSIKTVTKKTPVEGDEPNLEDIAVNTVNDKWFYITGPAASTDDFTVEFKDYLKNGDEIELGDTIVYDVELEATDSFDATATYTITLTATAEKTILYIYIFNQYNSYIFAHQQPFVGQLYFCTVAQSAQFNYIQLFIQLI